MPLGSEYDLIANGRCLMKNLFYLLLMVLVLLLCCPAAVWAVSVYEYETVFGINTSAGWFGIERDIFDGESRVQLGSRAFRVSCSPEFLIGAVGVGLCGVIAVLVTIIVALRRRPEQAEP